MNTIIDELQAVPTTCISDAMQGLNHLDPAIKPLKEEYKICGRAVTVKMPAGDNMMVLKAMKEASPGDVLVIDSEGYLYRSVAGDFVIGLAQTLGFSGVVAYGTVRDIASIKEMNFPVFCMGSTVACSKKIGLGEINVPVSCGSATISPGDIIVGDADGVIAIPQHKAEHILQAAKQKMQKDQERAETVLKNREAAIKYIDSLLAEK